VAVLKHLAGYRGFRVLRIRELRSWERTLTDLASETHYDGLVGELLASLASRTTFEAGVSVVSLAARCTSWTHTANIENCSFVSCPSPCEWNDLEIYQGEAASGR